MLGPWHGWLVRRGLRGLQRHCGARHRSVVSRNPLVPNPLPSWDSSRGQRRPTHRGHLSNGGQQPAVVLREAPHADQGDRHQLRGALHRPEGPRVPLLHLPERLLPARDPGRVRAAGPAGWWCQRPARLPAGALRPAPAGAAERRAAGPAALRRRGRPRRALSGRLRRRAGRAVRPGAAAAVLGRPLVDGWRRRSGAWRRCGRLRGAAAGMAGDARAPRRPARGEQHQGPEGRRQRRLRLARLGARAQEEVPVAADRRG
mmetsp:Transcript_18306/g.51705  ORF Transcript_18306/g.51705 Transcript_18306/m.51705 type:complete len:259 (-) Transcript_18306:114-890(-)